MECIVQGALPALLQQLFGPPQSLRRIGGDAFSQCQRGIHQFLRGNHGRNQPHGKCLCRVHHVAGERHFCSARHADSARQQPASAIARNDAEFDKTFCKTRVAGRDAYVAHARQVVACAYRCAVDRRDDGHLQSLKGARNALNTRTVIGGDLLGAATEHALLVTHLCYVAA